MPNHPIFAPTFHGDLGKVRKLLDEDPSIVSVRDAKNLTPMHVAASRGQSRVIQLLLDYGADIGGPTPPGEWTPLVFASYRGHLGAVEVLASNGADLTKSGGDPIHFAGQRRHKDICRFLVQHGAIDDTIPEGSPHLRDLFHACYGYESDSVKESLTNHPDLIDACDKQGRTLMHQSAFIGDSKTVRLLLKLGASSEVRDDRGETPLDRARAHRQHNVVKLLEQHQERDAD